MNYQEPVRSSSARRISSSAWKPVVELRAGFIPSSDVQFVRPELDTSSRESDSLGGSFVRAVAGMDSPPTSTLAQRGEFDGVSVCELR